MKKNLIRKIAVSVTALTVAAAMNATAFAAELTSGVAVTSDQSVNISKVLTVINPDLASVDGPGMSYSYEISSVTPSNDNGGTSVTDANNNTGTVHAGPAGGVSLETNSVSFPAGTQVNASDSGTANKKYFTAVSDLSKFTAPGIYRYRITETPDPADITSTGVTDTGDRDRYLDIYIVNGDGGLAVAGYTLHDRYNNKTDGFNGGSGGPGQPFTGAAELVTKNIILTQEVSGNMGDRNNQFPFTAKITDNGRSFYASKGEAPASNETDKIAGSETGSVMNTTLSHQEKYYISGLSSAAKVEYTETNNTPDTYSVSIEGGTPSEGSQVAPEGTKNMTQTGVLSADSVKFVNKLDTVTPTGVAMRYGASFCVIAAGLLLAAFRCLGMKKSR